MICGWSEFWFDAHIINNNFPSIQNSFLSSNFTLFCSHSVYILRNIIQHSSVGTIDSSLPLQDGLSLSSPSLAGLEESFGEAGRPSGGDGGRAALGF